MKDADEEEKFFTVPVDEVVLTDSGLTLLLGETHPEADELLAANNGAEMSIGFYPEHRCFVAIDVEAESGMWSDSKLEFGLVVEEMVAFILMRSQSDLEFEKKYGKISVSCPIAHVDESELTPLDEAFVSPMTVFLCVMNLDGLVQNLRTLTTNENFTKMYVQTVQKLSERHSLNEETFIHSISTVYNKYRKDADLWDIASAVCAAEDI
ncbi:MAG: hypothetical protein P8R36_04075 [Actinomycetota bacterium]|nr:hypothetical protein [Actinomycetota bacterium]MDG2120555.1 hypothetical protein [Actinomycetota bacterium]